MMCSLMGNATLSCNSCMPGFFAKNNGTSSFCEPCNYGCNNCFYDNSKGTSVCNSCGQTFKLNSIT